MLALFFFALLYLLLTYRLIFVSVPQMLREADTAVNTMAIVAAASWVACSAYVAALIVNRKTAKKGKDQE